MSMFLVRWCMVLFAFGMFSTVSAVAQEPRGFPELTRENVEAIQKALPPALPEKPKTPRRVLVYAQTTAKYHDTAIAWAGKALALLGETSGAFQVEISHDPAILTAEKLKPFDTIVWNNAMVGCFGTGDDVPARKKALLDFVRGGKGIVGIHSVTAIEGGDKEPATELDRDFRDMWGAIFERHPWEIEYVGLRIESLNHPLTAAFGSKKQFTIPYPEEIYQFRPCSLRDSARVLVSVDLATTVDKGSHVKKDYPLAWIKPFGKGRVFYSAFGHGPDSFHNQQFLTFLRNGVRYALGDLPADATPIPMPAHDLEAGYKSLFNGKDLMGWRGDVKHWTVEDGAITGRTFAEPKLTKNQYLIWEGGQPAEFDFKAKFKLTGGNSGIYFHSVERKPNEPGDPLVGPQADFSADHKWTGVVMEYLLREKLADRGRKVLINDKGERKDIGSLGDPAELLKAYREKDWNEYHVIVRNNLTVLRINDVLLCELRDNDPKRPKSGLLAVQVHVGPPMTVQFKDIRIKVIKPSKSDPK